MVKQAQKLTIFIFGGAILVWLCAAPVRAQVIGTYPPIKKVSKKKVVSTTSTTRKPRTPRKQTVNVVVRETTRVVKTSNLSVTSQPGAAVALVSLVTTVKAPAPQTVASNGVVIFENLKAGEYKIVVTLDGFETLEQDLVKIKPQTTHGIKLDLKPVTYDLKLDTNIAEGEVRFAPSVLTRTDIEGNLVTQETGGFCIVKIVKNKAVIPELKKGYYNLEIYSTEVEYESLKVAVKVPDDIPEESDESGEVESYSFELQKKISTEQFASAWTNSEWNLPTGWKLQNKMLTNGLSGIALPSSEQYRYYVDFEMMSNVTLLNDDTAGFVFRALDAENYYLVRLSGARAAEPYRAKGYVVKKGNQGNAIFSISLEPFAEIMKKQFRFIIKAEGNLFKFFIEDSATGDNREVGNMVDTFNNFKKGAVGIAGTQNSKFEVVSFIVLCKGKCR